MEDTLTTSAVPAADPWQRVWRMIPGAVLGIYLARMGGELVGLPGWTAAFALAAVLAIAVGWLLARWPPGRTWPALILLVYVVYPEADTVLGVFVGAVALVAAAQVAGSVLEIQTGRTLRIVSVIILFVGFFGLYVRTLAPDVLPADSGELQVVATTLGVAHPPGFPLYVMLGHLWSLLPFGPSPAYRLNLFSAFTSTLALVFVYQTVVTLARRRPLPAGWTAAIALGTATTFWAQATTTNIRSLTGLFTAMALYFLVCFGRSVPSSDKAAGQVPNDRWLILAAATLGFGITHHVSLAFLALVAVVYVFSADCTLWRTPRRWLWPILAGLAGLLPLLYLPLRANSGARGTSPQLATLSGFLEHVLATGFRGDLFYFTDPVTFWERLRVMGNILTFQFVPVLLLGMGVGLILLIIHDKLLAWLFGGTAVIFTLIAATYRAPQTVEYMMPAYVALAVCLGYGLGHLPDPRKPSRALGMAVSQFFCALLLVSAVNQGVQRFDSYDILHRDTTARDVAEGLLAGAAPDSAILSHWHWVTPLWYLQEVEGQRTDVSARFVYPDGESYSGTWAGRVQEAFDGGQDVIATFYDPATYQGLPLPEPVGEAYLFRHEPRTELPDGYEPLSVTLGDRIELVGYQQTADSAQAGEPILLTVAWRPIGEPVEGLSLFAHLLGPDSQVWGQEDVQVTAQPDGLTLTQFRVTPRPGTPLGTLLLGMGAYTDEPLPDAQGEVRVPVGNVVIAPNDLSPYTQQPLSRLELSAANRRLVGYDWDRTIPDQPRLYLHWASPDGYWTEVRDHEFEASGELYDLPPYRGAFGVPSPFWYLPAYSAADQYVPFGGGITWTGESLATGGYQAGESFTLDQTLHSDRPLLRDYVVSTRLIGLEPDGQLWAWWDLTDSVPGLGAVPTLKWIEGSTVLSPHRLTVNADAPAGQQLTGALTIYDAFTNRPLPILDERITAESAWVPLGVTTVEE